jgi:hypothetical protein
MHSHKSSLVDSCLESKPAERIALENLSHLAMVEIHQHTVVITSSHGAQCNAKAMGTMVHNSAM